MANSVALNSFNIAAAISVKTTLQETPQNKPHSKPSGNYTTERVKCTAQLRYFDETRFFE
jgi:hypothetical protein